MFVIFGYKYIVDQILLAGDDLEVLLYFLGPILKKVKVFFYFFIFLKGDRGLRSHS